MLGVIEIGNVFEVIILGTFREGVDWGLPYRCAVRVLSSASQARLAPADYQMPSILKGFSDSAKTKRSDSC